MRDAGLLGDILILFGAFSLGFLAGIAYGPVRGLFAGVGRAPGRLLKGTQRVGSRVRQAVAASTKRPMPAHYGFTGGLQGAIANLLTLRVRRAEASFREGCDAFDHGDYARARSNLAKALIWDRKLELKPLHVRAHLQLGWLDEQQGNWAAAKRHYARAVELDPDSSLATQRLGMMHSYLGETGQAVFQLQRALQLDPTNLETHYCLYAIYRQAGMESDSRKQLRILKAGESEQELSELFARHGEDNFRQCRYAAAASDFQLAVELAPSHVPPYIALGDLHYLDRQVHAAVEVWCCGLWAGYSQALVERVQAVAGADVDLLSAIQLIRGVVQRHAEDGRYHAVLSHLLHRVGQDEESLAELEEAVRQSPELLEAQQALGDRYSASGEQAKAAQTYRVALAAARAHEAVYSCHHCGYVTRVEQKRCFRCNRWGTLRRVGPEVSTDRVVMLLGVRERAISLRRKLGLAWNRAAR